MAPQYPFARKEKPPEDAVFLNRLIGIGGTGRIVSASGWKMRRNSALVEFYYKKKAFQGEIKLFPELRLLKLFYYLHYQFSIKSPARLNKF